MVGHVPLEDVIGVRVPVPQLCRAAKSCEKKVLNALSSGTRKTLSVFMKM